MLRQAKPERHVSGQAPLQLFRRVFKSIVEECTRGAGRRLYEVVERRAHVLAPYDSVFSDLPETAHIPPPVPVSVDRARAQLVDCIDEVIRALAEQRPLLLIFDDLQWADELSLKALEHVAARLVYGGATLELGRDTGVALAERYVLTPLGSAVILGLLGLLAALVRAVRRDSSA